MAKIQVTVPFKLLVVVGPGPGGDCAPVTETRLFPQPGIYQLPDDGSEHHWYLTASGATVVDDSTPVTAAYEVA